MFAQLPSPDLAYEMFKLRESELIKEAEMGRLAGQLRAAGPHRRHRLMVWAGRLLVSLGIRLEGRPASQPTGSLTASRA